MSKKDFSGGLNTLLGDNPEEPKKTGRPKTATKEITKTSQEGTKESETRATFIVNEEQLEKLKSIAYWDRLLIKDVVAQALEDYLTKYEKKNGAIKPAPAK
jgi:predicted nucleic acid-binding protein